MGGYSTYHSYRSCLGAPRPTADGLCLMDGGNGNVLPLAGTLRIFSWGEIYEQNLAKNTVYISPKSPGLKQPNGGESVRL